MRVPPSQLYGFWENHRKLGETSWNCQRVCHLELSLLVHTT